VTELADRRATAFFEVVRENAERDDARVAYRFLPPGHRAGDAGTTLTRGGLDRRARAVAARLQDLGAGRDAAVLVAAPPGLGFLTALYGCLYAGAPAVPCPPAGPGTAGRLAEIARDSGARIVVTEPAPATGPDPTPGTGLDGLTVLDLGEVENGAADSWRSPATSGGDLVLLQYSSGSTGTPKGIAVSAEALLAQLENFRALSGLPRGGNVVDWLPLVHALGLGHLLLAQLTGGEGVFLTPEDFVADPLRWLAAISRLDAPVLSGGPSFAYQRCADQIGPGRRSGLDLGGWHTALIGGERVRPGTLEQFAATFGPCGFRREALFPAYGLTETMQIVVGHGDGAPPVLSVDAAELDRGRVRRHPGGPGGLEIMPCGPAGPNARVRIVEPERRVVRGEGEVGEIWVDGPVVCPGYWRRPEETAATFQARLADGDGPYLRTGDLGFLHDGELYVCGRLKELVIVHGRNLYPQDIEDTAAHAHPALTAPGAAFSVEGDEGEELVVIQPFTAEDGVAPAEIAQAVKNAVARTHEVEPLDVLVVRPEDLPRTGLGKVRRNACRDAYRDGTLNATARLTRETRKEGGAPEAADARALVESLAPERRAPVVEAEVRRRVAGVLGVGPADLKPDVPLVGLGLESVRSIALRQALERDFAIALPAADVLGGTVGSLTEAVTAALEDHGGEEPLWPELTADAERRFEPFPLTELQHAYLVGRASSFDLGGSSIHLYAEHHTRPGEKLDAERLRTALDLLVARHEMLRAVVTPDGEQRILPEVPPVEIPEYDLREATAEEAEAHVGRVRAELDHQVLALDRWPPFDIRVTWLPDGTALVHVSLDLVSFDVASVRLFFLEWGDLYRNPDAQLPPVGVSFRDFVLAAEGIKDTPAYRRSRAYWQARAATLPPAPRLPLVPRPAQDGPPRRRRRKARVDARRWRILRERAARLGVTPSALLLAAYATVLGAWSGSRHFTVDVPLFSRYPLHPDIEHILGDFTSVTLLEADLRPDDGVGGLARRMQRRLWEDLEHRYYSGPEVMRDVQRAQGLPPSAFASVVFASVGAHGRDQEFTQGEWGSRWLGELGYGITQTPQVLLDHQVYEDDGALTFNWDAVDAAFPEGLVEAMFGTYTRLLTALADDEGAWEPGGFDVLPPDQRAMIDAANDTAGPVPDGLLFSGIAEQARTRPGEPAVISAAGTLSFGELYGHAGRIAARLRELGAGPGRLVAVNIPKSAEQVAAVVGVLRSGAAYLPMDPELPRERQDFMLEHGRVAVVLVPPGGAGRDWPDGVTPVPVDLSVPADDAPDPEPVQEPSDLAYVLYTSGSTGTPKGVAQTHRATLNTLVDANERMGAGPGDRVLGLSQLGFDLSVWDVFGALGAGAALVLPGPGESRSPDCWAALMAEHRVTLWNSVPALMRMLVDHLDGAGERARASMAGLRAVWFSGDWIPVDLPGRVRAYAPDALVIASGGPTETAIWCVAYPVTEIPEGWESVPYGRPMRNHTIHVLDECLRPCPVWVPGEMYIGGAGLADGYWRDPERTAASFVTHPVTGERLYRSGDLGRWRPEGLLEILGRDDFQVKVNGYRIELGEVESALAGHPAVRQAVAGTDRERRRLVAFVTTSGADAGDPGHDGEFAAAIEDPMERLAFKASRHGLRRDLDGERVALPSAAPDEVYERRSSHRTFADRPATREEIGGLLEALRSRPGATLPKYRYGSAGSLYPVQTYLFVRGDGVTGLPAGTYYHDPDRHELVRIRSGDVLDSGVQAASNRPLFEAGSFAVFLIARRSAIEPLYGERTRDFCLLEAGLMTQLLEQAAPEAGLGLCQVGLVRDTPGLRDALALEEDHEVLHGLVGGPRAEAGATGTGTTEATPAVPGDLAEELREHLAARLPAYMVPSSIHVLDRLPLTPRGKVDRMALRDLADRETGSGAAARADSGPASELERTMVTVFAEALGTERVGVTANFAEIGADSVTIVKVHRRLQSVLGREFPLLTMFEYPNIRRLAAHLSDASGDPGGGRTDRASSSARAGFERARRRARRRGMDGRSGRSDKDRRQDGHGPDRNGSNGRGEA
jgi:amino acid adenylation domain-containing protein